MSDAVARLVVGPAWIGDMVMAQSLYKTLHRLYPEDVVDVVAPVWSRPLLERMPEVRNAIELPLGHGSLGLRARRALGRQLRARHYQQAIVLPNSFKSALVPWWAKIPRRTGYRGEWRYGVLNDIRPLDRQRLPMTVQRYVALGQPRDAAQPPEVPLPALEVRAESVDAARRALGLANFDAPILALCPGAEFGPAKRWPEAHFAEVAQRKLTDGWQVWLFGSAIDKPITARINALAGGGCNDLSGRTSLSQAVDLLSVASTVVSNDSGLMHVAASVGRTLIAIYGSSDPKYTPPLGAGSTIMHRDLPCSPCFRRECPYGHYDCLHDIAPTDVLQVVEATYGGQAQRA